MDDKLENLTHGVSDDDLLRAVSLRFDAHVGALNVANGMGGSETTPWLVVRSFKPELIMAEIDSRKLDITKLEVAMASCECCPRLVVETDMYARLTGKSKIQRQSNRDNEDDNIKAHAAEHGCPACKGKLDFTGEVLTRCPGIYPFVCLGCGKHTRLTYDAMFTTIHMGTPTESATPYQRGDDDA